MSRKHENDFLMSAFRLLDSRSRADDFLNSVVGEVYKNFSNEHADNDEPYYKEDVTPSISTVTFPCPHCGTHMTVDFYTKVVTCGTCGLAIPIEDIVKIKQAEAERDAQIAKATAQRDIRLKELEYQEKLLENERHKRDDKSTRWMLKLTVWILLGTFIVVLISRFLT